MAQRPSRHGMRVRPSGRFPSDLRRPCGSFMEGKPVFDKERHDQVIDEVMALRSSWVSPARKSV